MIEFGVLGPLRVRSDHGEIKVSGARRRALLIRLLVSANHAVPTARLAEDLWEGRPPAGAPSTLASHVSLLRQLLARDRIRGGDGGYALTVGDDELDASCFEREVGQGRRALAAGQPEDAVELLLRALGRWRGPALDDVAATEWARPDAVRLDELHLGAQELLLDARLELGQHDEVAAAAEAAVAAHPLREQFWGQLMTALARSGRQAEALRAYQRLRTTLGEELGLEPSESLVQLERAILVRDPDLSGTPARNGQGRRGVMRSLGADRVPLPPALDTGASARCVGRGAQLRSLQQAWQATRDGARRAVFVGGEPGIGKSRLVSELGDRLHAEGATVLYGRCDEDLGVPYQPFAEALRHYLVASGLVGLGDQFPNLTRVVPELGLRIASVALPGVDPGIERWCLFEDVAALFESASSERPMVLILEDLHWAAAPSLLLLRHLVRAKDPAALLIVGTYRDSELHRDDPLSALLADFASDDSVTRLALTGLDEAGVLDYVEASTGVELDERGQLFASILYDEASGNPLFIGEVLRHFLETGVVSAADGRWTIEGDPLDGVPPTVRDVISRRVGRLPAAARTALSVASCCHSEFELAWLETILHDEEAILEGLEHAVEARIVDELPAAGHYTFSHSVIRRTLYEELSITRRSRIHGQLGLAIEADKAADLAPFFATLSFHFSRAADPRFSGKAAAFALAAAERGLSQLAVEDALHQASVGLELLDREPHPDRTLRADLQMARAQALLFAGEIAESKAAAAAAASDARAIGSAPRMAAAAAARGWHSSPGDVDPLVPELCQEVLDTVGATDTETRARALATLATYLGVNLGETVEAGPLAAEAVTLARSVGSPSLLWQALYAQSHVLWPTERMDERLAIADEMVHLAGAIEEVEPSFQSLYFRGVVRLEGGDRAGFEADLAELEGRAAADHQYWVPAAVINLWRTLLCLLDGRMADAEARVFAGLGAVPKSDLIFRTSFVAQLFAIRREQGRLEELIPGFEATLNRRSIPAVEAGLAVAHAEVGNLDAARAMLDVLAADAFSVLRRDSTWTIQLADVADVVALVEAHELAAPVHALLAPDAGQVLVASPGCFCAGAVDRYLGMLAALMGQLDTARVHYERALVLETRLGSVPLVARTKIAYARSLLRHGRADDRPLARDLIAEARASSRLCGLTALERAGDALLTA